MVFMVQRMVAVQEPTLISTVVHGDDVRAAYAEVRRAMAEALMVLAQFDAHGGWEVEGFASSVTWLAANAHLTRSDAAREVRNARLTHTYPAVGHALTAGQIAPAHLTQLASIARHRSRKFGDDVAVLVETATHVDPEGFRQVATHWKSLADDLLAPDERDERNMLDLAESYAGSWVLRGVFDDVRGATLHRMLLERSAPTGSDDPRSAAERRADAFFEILTGSEPMQPRVDVIVDVDTFVGAFRPIEDIRCELAGQGSIERVVMERLACNGHIGRVLTRGKHEVVELGRQVRLATPAQRRAVVARDQGCVWPHCKRPPSMCEVHHVVPWQKGGESTVDNLALLCGAHHTRVHKGWELHRYPAGNWDALPP